MSYPSKSAPLFDTLARGVVRAEAECPTCGAPIGHFCRRNNGGLRKSNHIERVKAAHRKVGIPVPHRVGR